MGLLTISLELYQLHIPSDVKHFLEDRPGFRILQFHDVRFGHLLQIPHHRRRAIFSALEEVRGLDGFSALQEVCARVQDEVGQQLDPI